MVSQAKSTKRSKGDGVLLFSFYESSFTPQTAASGARGLSPNENGQIQRYDIKSQSHHMSVIFPQSSPLQNPLNFAKNTQPEKVTPISPIAPIEEEKPKKKSLAPDESRQALNNQKHTETHSRSRKPLDEIIKAHKDNWNQSNNDKTTHVSKMLDPKTSECAVILESCDEKCISIDEYVRTAEADSNNQGAEQKISNKSQIVTRDHKMQNSGHKDLSGLDEFPTDASVSTANSNCANTEDLSDTVPPPPPKKPSQNIMNEVSSSIPILHVKSAQQTDKKEGKNSILRNKNFSECTPVSNKHDLKTAESEVILKSCDEKCLSRTAERKTNNQGAEQNYTNQSHVFTQEVELQNAGLKSDRGKFKEESHVEDLKDLSAIDEVSTDASVSTEDFNSAEEADVSDDSLDKASPCNSPTKLPMKDSLYEVSNSIPIRHVKSAQMIKTNDLLRPSQTGKNSGRASILRSKNLAEPVSLRQVKSVQFEGIRRSRTSASIDEDDETVKSSPVQHRTKGGITLVKQSRGKPMNMQDIKRLDRLENESDLESLWRAFQNFGGKILLDDFSESKYKPDTIALRKSLSTDSRLNKDVHCVSDDDECDVKSVLSDDGVVWDEVIDDVYEVDGDVAACESLSRASSKISKAGSYVSYEEFIEIYSDDEEVYSDEESYDEPLSVPKDLHSFIPHSAMPTRPHFGVALDQLSMGKNPAIPISPREDNNIGFFTGIFKSCGL